MRSHRRCTCTYSANLLCVADWELPLACVPRTIPSTGWLLPPPPLHHPVFPSFLCHQSCCYSARKACLVFSSHNSKLRPALSKLRDECYSLGENHMERNAGPGGGTQRWIYVRDVHRKGKSCWNLCRVHADDSTRAVCVGISRPSR